MTKAIRVRACLAVVQQQRLLLVPHHQTDMGAVQWYVPGGRVEFGEGVELAALREFEEETGLRAQITGLLDVSEVIITQSQSRGSIMSEIKPIVPEALLLEVLQQQFGEPVNDVQVMEGGSVARTFTFSISGQEYVIRFNSDSMDASFAKERYIANHFSSPLVPIPNVIQIGQMHNLTYCISEKAIGRRLEQLSSPEVQHALPSLIATLDAIHAVDVRQQPGHGNFDDQGQGLFPSWSAWLGHVREEERPDGYFGQWHQLFETSFLERDLFEHIYTQMESLLDSCPQERSLVHGDYGFGNVLVANGQVTAVLDWLNAKYGDFLYDVAWLDFWDSKRGYRDLFQAHYAERGVNIPNYERRLACYQCHIALDGLRFFAKANNHAAYQWVKDQILRLMPPD